jgi:hypothetical protein
MCAPPVPSQAEEARAPRTLPLCLQCRTAPRAGSCWVCGQLGRGLEPSEAHLVLTWACPHCRLGNVEQDPTCRWCVTPRGGPRHPGGRDPLPFAIRDIPALVRTLSGKGEGWGWGWG